LEAVIYRHVFENADREVGGVLIGRMAADGGLPLLTGAIPAISADERRATLTFTQEAWAHVHRVLESEFPAEEQIVGWYHSHPGFGIFLSGHDLFIHENFFNAPSQIAVVVDPHARLEGVFAWREGELGALFERPTPSGWLAANSVRGPEGTADAGSAGAAGTGPARAGEGRLAGTAGANASGQVAVPAPHDRYPVLVLVIAAVLGVLMGFGAWSLTEGGTSTSARARSTPAKVHVVGTRSARESTLEGNP
jgi:proteasome lid subunit RPN8/RPN11